MNLCSLALVSDQFTVAIFVYLSFFFEFIFLIYVYIGKLKFYHINHNCQMLY